MSSSVDSFLTSALALGKFLNPERILISLIVVRTSHYWKPAKPPFFYLKSHTADLSWLSLAPGDQFFPILWAQEGAHSIVKTELIQQAAPDCCGPISIPRWAAPHVRLNKVRYTFKSKTRKLSLYSTSEPLAGLLLPDLNLLKNISDRNTLVTLWKGQLLKWWLIIVRIWN